MNRSDYETEVHDELKDNGTYKEIKEDLTTKIECSTTSAIFSVA
jgi:hypothetical protein